MICNFLVVAQDQEGGKSGTGLVYSTVTKRRQEIQHRCSLRVEIKENLLSLPRVSLSLIKTDCHYAPEELRTLAKLRQFFHLT